MNNSLRNIEKSLRSLSKRCKEIKYTKGMLLSFLMTGVVSHNINAENNKDEIKESQKDLEASIEDMKQIFKEARKENRKLIKDVDLELIQLMEQGDHVIKSPWSSWQFGTGYSLEDWKTEYKGSNDKAEKYPYVGIFTRESNEMNRYISRESDFYSSLVKGNASMMSLNNYRNDMGYGFLRIEPINERPASMEINAAIRPKTVNKADITIIPEIRDTPQFPETASFSPIKIEIQKPQSPGLPPAPSYRMYLGNNCNNSFRCVWSWGAHGSTAWLSTITPTVEDNSQQNIKERLNYTNIRGMGNIALKYRIEPNNSSTLSYMMEDTLKPHPWEDMSDITGKNEIFFNSYNFGDEFVGTTLAQAIIPDPNNPLFTIDLNKQYFFVGGSRFFDIDNIIQRKEWGIPAGKTIQLGGVLAMGITSSQNFVIAVNRGTITDVKEKDDNWIKNMPTDAGKDYLTLYNGTETYQVRRSADGYVGYKVGMGLSSEDGHNYANKQDMKNEGTIDFRGEKSIGMYSYITSEGHTSNAKAAGDQRMYAKFENSGNILLSGNGSYGIKISAITEEEAEARNTGLIHIRKNPDGVDRADNSVGFAIMNDPTIGSVPGLVDGANFTRGQAVNDGTIRITDVENSTGMYLDIDSDLTNRKDIEISSQVAENTVNPHSQSYNIGMRAQEWRGRSGSAATLNNAKVINEDTGKISIDGKYGIGMLARQANIVNKGTITSTDIKNGIGIYAIEKSKVENSGAIKIIGTGKALNTGVFLDGETEGVIGVPGSVTQSLEVSGNNSTGVLVTGQSTLTMAGDVNVIGEGVSGIIADNGEITMNGGKVSVYAAGSGGSKEAAGKTSEISGGSLKERGSYGIAVIKGGKGKFEGSNVHTEIKVSSDRSIGIYSEGELIIGRSDVTAKEGAFNFSLNNGTIEIRNGGTAETGERSLLFYSTGNSSRIRLGSNLVASIKGGSTPQSRGTAFYLEGSGHSQLTAGDISAYFSTLFDNTLNRLTLNMEDGSRLLIASDVSMNLSGTDVNNFFGSGTGPTINGNLGKYKTVMLNSGKLNIDKNVDLDNDQDFYNLMEIANSSIVNNSEIAGTRDSQAAMAQESVKNMPSGNVVLTNETGGTVRLSGEKSVGLYAKRGRAVNSGLIEIGKRSTGIYLTDDNQGPASTENDGKAENYGTIRLEENAIGMYYKNEGYTAGAGITEGFRNRGRIESDKDKAVGMFLEASIGKDISNDIGGVIDLRGQKSVGIYAAGTGGYVAGNRGTVLIGDALSETTPGIGMFTVSSDVRFENSGNIAAGKKSVGIYGYDAVQKAGGSITVDEEGTGIYSRGGNVLLESGSAMTVKNNKATGVYYTGDNGIIRNAGSNMTIGEGSFGFVVKGNGTFGNTVISENSSNVSLDRNSVYIYSNDDNVKVRNYTGLTSSKDETYGIYSSGDVVNYGNIDFSNGIGNVAVYSVNGGMAVNEGGIITMGNSLPVQKKYSIGMAAGYEVSDSGNIVNKGTINVSGNNSIGMYATGQGSTAINRGTINLTERGAVGMYLDEGAKGENHGTITTVGSPDLAVGIVVKNGSELINHEGAKIHINSAGGVGIYKVFSENVVIRNYGDITVGNGAKAEDRYVPGGAVMKEAGGVRIEVPVGASSATMTYNGNIVTDIDVIKGDYGARKDILSSEIGMYVDTLRKTNPIKGLENIKTDNADLIVGIEAAEKTNSKYIQASDELIRPYTEIIRNNPQIKKWGIYSASATWLAAPTYDSEGIIEKIYMAKIPYTAFINDNNREVQNLLDGIEKRYDQNGLDSREKHLFNKLNGVGNNEFVFISQAFDEMMGHQYANIQQRVHSTGRILEKELENLKKEWNTKSRQSNKINAFGMRDEYRIGTAGIIDYKSDAYGVAYVHEDEAVKLGNASGWYGGAVHNRIKFKDIGGSREDVTMIKAGLFKSVAFDHNNSLNWTVSGEGFVSRSDMHRKYLVVDEIFNAKSTYHTYGGAVRNELGKEFRTSERISIRPYGSLKLEYGRFGNIKEKTGEVRLEVKGNDYYSIRPELGVEFKYRQPMAVKTSFVTILGLGYENELGKVGNVGNRARVNYTDAGWYGIRGEKDDRKGSFKVDLNIGLENQRFGVTINAGYDTKGKNVRGGIGFRMIY